MVRRAHGTMLLTNGKVTVTPQVTVTSRLLQLETRQCRPVHFKA